MPRTPRPEVQLVPTPANAYQVRVGRIEVGLVHNWYGPACFFPNPIVDGITVEALAEIARQIHEQYYPGERWTYEELIQQSDEQLKREYQRLVGQLPRCYPYRDVLMEGLKGKLKRDANWQPIPLAQPTAPESPAVAAVEQLDDAVDRAIEALPEDSVTQVGGVAVIRGQEAIQALFRNLREQDGPDEPCEGAG